MKHLLLLFSVIFSLASVASTSHVHFKNWNEAYQYYVKNVAPFDQSIRGLSRPAKLVDRSSNEYQEINKLIKKIHSGFLKAMPEKNLNKNPPHVMIVEDDLQRAYVYTNPKTQRKPYLFMVHKGLLKIPSNQLEGIIAHELVHLYLQGYENGHRYPSKKYYLSDGLFYFNNEINHNSVLERNLELFNNAGGYIGMFDDEILGGIPMDFAQENASPYREIFYLLINAPQDDICTDAQNKHWKLKYDLLHTYYDKTTGFLEFENLDNKNMIKNQVKEVEFSLGQCLQGMKYDRLEIYSFTYGLSKEMLSTILSNSKGIEKESLDETAYYYENMDTISAIFAVTRLMRERRSNLLPKLDFEKTRIYTEEDHADEIAVKVLFELGISPDGLNDFFISHNKDASCDYKNPSFPEPYYGRLSSIHHNDCWRAYRNNALYKKLVGGASRR